jgi:hypothetical protein
MHSQILGDIWREKTLALYLGMCGILMMHFVFSESSGYKFILYFPVCISVEYVVMHNESGPLGIHVVPDYDRLGKDRGLLVQGIEPGGRIDRDGRLAVYDRIIEINGQNLLNMPFQR